MGRGPKARFYKAVSPSLVEPRFTFGLSDRLNFGISVWSGHLGPIIVTKVVSGIDVDAMDIGLRGMMKYRFTSDESKYQVALITNYTEYLYLGDIAERFAWGVSPAIILSRELTDEFSVYTISKYNFMTVEHRFSPFPSIHLGLTQLIKQTKWHFEFIYSYVRPPLSEAKRGHVLTLSGGRTWTLN